MSDVRRYSMEPVMYSDESEMVPMPDGDYVRYEDYAALRTRLAAAEALLWEYEGASLYEHEDDEAGSRVCCGVRSYKPHAGTCALAKYLGVNLEGGK